jgi:hypothetical protein
MIPSRMVSDMINKKGLPRGNRISYQEALSSNNTDKKQKEKQCK